jgi:hypothetical protein
MENGNRPSEPSASDTQALNANYYSRPVFTYLKSRGFYAGVQVDGTVIIERTDENERFYGEKIKVADILAGKARHPPYEIKKLMETLKAAEGSTNVDESLMRELDLEPAPADIELSSPTTDAPTFGIPEPDDPDPFGVLALEKEGFEIREAGTKERPPSSQFEFNPSPTSPVYSKFHRRSMDTLGSQSNRASYMSNISMRTARTSTDRATQTTEMGTQTDDFTPGTSPSFSDDRKRIVEEDEKPINVEPEEIDYTKIDLGPYSNLNHSQEFDGTTVNESPREPEADKTEDSALSNYATEDEDEEEEPVIFEAASAQATVLTPQAIKARGGVVNIPKRPPPPPLPPRNVARGSRVMMIDQGSGLSPSKSEFSNTSISSPRKSEFEEVDLHGVERKRESLSVDTGKVEALKDEQKDDSVKEEDVKGIVLQDLEEADKSHEDVNGKVDEVLKEEHLEKIESTATETPEVEKEKVSRVQAEEEKPVGLGIITPLADEHTPVEHQTPFHSEVPGGFPE